MSSDFEKALARASAERSARDDAKAQQEREHAEKVALAHSIIDPYLAKLGPQVVRTLRELGISQEKRKDKYGRPLPNTDYWKFWCYRYVDDGHPVYEWFVLDSHGQFARSPYGAKAEPIQVALLEGGRIEWQKNGYGEAAMLANPDDRKVYVKRVYTNAGPILQELSEFMAEHIYHEMKH